MFTSVKKTSAATLRAAAIKNAHTAPKLEAARALWDNLDYTVEDIRREVGLSRRTLYLHLGPRYRRQSLTPPGDHATG